MEDDEKYEKENDLTSFYRNNKILVWLLIFIILLIVVLKFVIPGNGNPNNTSSDIQIVIEPKDNVSVGLGNSINLIAKVNVENAIVTWSSSDTTIASVSNGNVIGISLGKAVISATYIDTNNAKYTASTEVLVVEGNPNVTLNSVNYPEGDLYIPVGKEYKPSLILTPSNALISEKLFTSSDNSIISVSEDGTIKGLREGHARIIANLNNKYQTAMDVYVSNDYANPEIIISPTSISFNNATRKIKVGDSEVLNYTVSPSNANRAKLTWSSSNTNIVTVDQSGRVKAINEGTATITLSTINGKNDTITIEVYNDIIPVQDISIGVSSINMEAGKTEVITPVVTPSNASNKEISFSSMDSNIVSVSINENSTSATLSALSKGSTSIIIKSGNIQKVITVNVTGEDNKHEVEEDDPNLPTTIQVRSNKNNLAKSYEEAKKIPVLGTASVSVTMSTGVGKIKYCVHKYGTSACTPDKEMYSNDNIIIPSGGIYVLRIIKYDYKDVEIPSTSKNYIDGVLHYYINTSNGEEEALQYTVSNTYDTETKARSFPVNVNDKVTISLNDNNRKVSICSTTTGSCTPRTMVTSDYTINLASAGLWRIFVNEYDLNNKQIGKTEVYYVFVSSTPTPTPVEKIRTTTSNLKVVDASAGKYLGIDLESDYEFNTPRFCYTLVNKNVTGTCNLDLSSSSVTYYDNGTIVRPKEELKTYYATMTRTKKYSFKFYLKVLDDLYNSNDTTKDVIFEFAVNTKEGYSNPIRVRIRMASKNGSNATWSVTRIS